MVRSRKRVRGDRLPRRCEWCGERFKPASRSHQRFHTRSALKEGSSRMSSAGAWACSLRLF